MPASVVWAQSFTPAEAPQTKKRKDTPAEYRHANEEWERYRYRIEELYEDNELLDVAAIMERETGFKASIPQYRHRLKIWGDWKYLKLSDKQWKYIRQMLMQREDEGKGNTAFKLSGKKIPSSRLQRELAAKFDLEDTEMSSLVSGISSCDISAYTSSTLNGVRPPRKSPQSTLTSVVEEPEQDSNVSVNRGTPRFDVFARLQVTRAALKSSQERLAYTESAFQRKIDEFERSRATWNLDKRYLEKTIDKLEWEKRQLQYSLNAKSSNVAESPVEFSNTKPTYGSIPKEFMAERPFKVITVPPAPEIPAPNVVHGALGNTNQIYCEGAEGKRLTTLTVEPLQGSNQTPESKRDLTFLKVGFDNAFRPIVQNYYYGDQFRLVQLDEKQWSLCCDDCDNHQMLFKLDEKCFEDITVLRGKLSNLAKTFEEQHVSRPEHRQNVLVRMLPKKEWIESFRGAGLAENKNDAHNAQPESENHDQNQQPEPKKPSTECGADQTDPPQQNNQGGATPVITVTEVPTEKQPQPPPESPTRSHANDFYYTTHAPVPWETEYLESLDEGVQYPPLEPDADNRDGALTLTEQDCEMLSVFEFLDEKLWEDSESLKDSGYSSMSDGQISP